VDRVVAHLQSKNQRGRLDARGAVDGEDRPLHRDPRQGLLATAGMRRGADDQACQNHQQQPHHKPGESPILSSRNRLKRRVILIKKEPRSATPT
jgi:hypothetical protein